MNRIYENILTAIGNTPLIKLRGPSEITGCNILGKAEFLNPGGSIKDRAALAIISDAEKKGIISKNGTIVEGTAGNTGIGLTLIGNAKGYKTIIIMPETQTKEKIDTLVSMGAHVKLVPAKPYKDSENYVKISSRIAKELSNENSFSSIIDMAIEAFLLLVKNRSQYFENRQKTIQTIVIGQRLGQLLEHGDPEFKQRFQRSTDIPIKLSTDRRTAALGAAMLIAC